MANKKPVIFFLSKSGAGKDTQADLLIEKFGLSYINTGDLLRSFTDDERLSSLDKLSTDYYEAQGIRSIIDKGKFIPTISVVSHWRNALLNIVREPTKTKGIVFVGVARKLGEALALHDFFETWPDAKANFRIMPVYMKVTDKEVKKRLLARLQCVGCRTVAPGLPEYKLIEECGRCGGKLIKRKDDTPSGIASRLGEFKEYVIPVLKYFQEQNILITINGEQSIENVHKDVVRALHLKNI